MIQIPVNISCPTNFQPLPDEKLLDHVPEDTQVLLIGEWHADLMQRRYFVDSLYDLNKANFITMTIELAHNEQEAFEEEFDMLKVENLRSKQLPSGKARNSLAGVPAAFSEYQVLARAKQLGMTTKWVDESTRNFPSRTRDEITSRNIHMAQKVLDQAKDGKVIHFVGNAHLYSGIDDSHGETSIQEYLQLEGIKTYTIGMVADRGHLFTRNCAFIAELDSEAASCIKSDFQNNLQDTQKRKPVRLDLHRFYKGSGAASPDELIVFSQEGHDWCETMFNYVYAERNVEGEKAIWDAIHGKKLKTAKL